jgi:hypothetical protein
VRILAGGEVVIGVALALSGAWGWYAATSAFFIGSFAFVLQARIRRLPLRTCGCFGREDSPISTAHLVGTASIGVAMAAGAIAASVSSEPIAPLSHLSPPALVLGVAVAILLYAMLGPLGALLARLGRHLPEPEGTA